MTQKRTHLILHFYFLSQCIYYFILGINIWYYVWNNGQFERKFSCCSTKGKTVLNCKPQEHVWGKSRFLGGQSWCFLYAGVTQTRGILALSLPWSSVSLCFSFLSSLGISSPNWNSVTIGRSRLPPIRLNGLNFQSFREYFWNVMKCVYISEPGPNLRQDEWHFCTGSCCFF